MARFHDIQVMLDRILGDSSGGNHRAFWRGKTRDEFIAGSVFGLPIIEVGTPVRSNLIRALKGEPPFGSDLTPRPRGAAIRRMPAGRPPASQAEIALIEAWIAQGCPDDAAAGTMALQTQAVTDDVHVRYWREIDFFFLPSLSSPQTRPHVGRLHMPAYTSWRLSNIDGGNPAVWNTYMTRGDVIESFRYIRLHQTRIIMDYYATSQDNALDSLWKFGGDLLPRDPLSGAYPEHRMNGVTDWFIWVPYLEMSLHAIDKTEFDVALARAWQVGIAADGLIRKDAERPAPGRMPIPDFNETDPNLQKTVFAKYGAMQPNDLIAGMLTRARAYL